MSWRYVYEILGGVLIFVSSLVGENLRSKKRWYAFCGVCAILYSMTGLLLDRRAENEQNELMHKVEQLEATIVSNNRRQKEQLERTENARRSDRDAFLNGIAQNLETTQHVLTEANRAVNPLTTENLMLDLEIRIPVQQDAVKAYLNRVKPDKLWEEKSPPDPLFPSLNQPLEHPLASLANFAFVTAYFVRKGERQFGLRLETICQRFLRKSEVEVEEIIPKDISVGQKSIDYSGLTSRHELAIWCHSNDVGSIAPRFRSLLDLDGATLFLRGFENDIAYSKGIVDYGVEMFALQIEDKTVIYAKDLKRTKCPQFAESSHSVCFTARVAMSPELLQ